ncbi:hypothetical protein ACM66T_10225 [Sulfurimonas sp. ST-25]|uniref:hypothetical protein n=1 Tax=Sulfurimonas sp. ST-25 TaxID=3400151 RepID=UPI003A83BECE
MTEAQAIVRIKAVLEQHIPVYKVVRLDADPLNPTQYVARFAAIFKEGEITQAMISDMLKEYTDNGGDLEFDGTRKELDNLDFDVMFVKATINAHEQ